MLSIGYHVQMGSRADRPGRYLWEDLRQANGQFFVYLDLGQAVVAARQYLHDHPEADGWVRVYGQGYQLFPETGRRMSVWCHGRVVTL